MSIIRASWTDEQVAALNRYQSADTMPPFTCGNDHTGDRELIATRDGWWCPSCEYRQDWAHDFMALDPIPRFT